MNRKNILLPITFICILLLTACSERTAQMAADDLLLQKITFYPKIPVHKPSAGETHFFYAQKANYPIFQNTVTRNSKKKEHESRSGLFLPLGYSVSFKVSGKASSQLLFSLSSKKSVKKGSLKIVFHSKKSTKEKRISFPNNRSNPRQHTIALPSKTETITFSAVSSPIWLYNPRIIHKKQIPRPPIIFCVIDAMRYDALTKLGGRANAAPALDQLVKESHLFANAYTAANWTRPSTISFFTGKLPWQTGIPTTLFSLDRATQKKYASKKIPTVATFLRKAGYLTRAIVNNIFMVGSTPLGIDMGFHHMTDYRVDGQDTQYIKKRGTAFIKQQNNEPFFLFLNFNAPHAPYDPPKRFLRQITGNGSKHYKRYMGEVAYSDYAFGKIIQQLKQQGIYDKAMIIVTSDHGEILNRRHSRAAFFDYLIYYTHGETAYNEEIRVPLILKLPKEHPQYGHKLVKRVVRLSDIPATIAAVTKLSNSFPGTPLTSNIKVNGGTTYFEGRMLEAVTDGRYTYSRRFPGYDMVQYKLDGPKYHIPEELYDRKKDPMELKNLATKNKALLQKMRKKLFSHPDKLANAKLHISLPTSSSSYRVALKLRSGAFYRFSPGCRIISLKKKEVVIATQNKKRLWVELFPAIFDGTISITDKKERPLQPLYGPFALPLFPGRARIAPKRNRLLSAQYEVNPHKKGIHIWLTGVRFDNKTQTGEAGMSNEMKSMLKNWGYIQ